MKIIEFGIKIEEKVLYSRRSQTRMLEEEAEILRKKSDEMIFSARDRGEILNILIDDATSQARFRK